MDKPAKATKPAARKRTTTARTTTPRPRKTTPKPAPVEIVEPVEPVPAPLPAAAVKQRSLRAIAGFGLVLAVAVTALLVGGRNDETSAQDSIPAAVSTGELASLAGSVGAPVYWAGRLPSRTLELTRTDAGTFVRYLPAGAIAGSSERALTIATYPLPDAYGTATGHAKEAGMASSPTRNGGLAVWSKTQPTSVYVAFRGVPSLVEIYSPQATEARAFALSGRVRPVR